MRRDVTWEHHAVEQFFEIATRDPKLAQRLLVTIRNYETGQRVDYKKLSGRDDTWRLRTGDWRILLVVDGDEAVVQKIDNRRDAY